MRSPKTIIVALVTSTLLVGIASEPAAGSTSYVTIIKKAISTTTNEAFKGSTHTSFYEMMGFNGKITMVIESAEKYKILTSGREAISIGKISYEKLTAEIDPDQMSVLQEVYPSAEWYENAAYPGMLKETFAQNFDDINYALSHAGMWKKIKNKESTAYRFNISDAKIDNGAESWYGLTKTNKASAEVIIDNKGRITKIKIEGPDRNKYATTMNIKYGKQKLLIPDKSTVITWDQVVKVVPSLAGVIPDGWVRLDDLSPSCKEALKPIRELVDEVPSGLDIQDNNLTRLNTALDSSHYGCSESEWERWYDLEFYGWLMGAERKENAN